MSNKENNSVIIMTAGKKLTVTDEIHENVLSLTSRLEKRFADDGLTFKKEEETDGKGNTLVCCTVEDTSGVPYIVNENEYNLLSQARMAYMIEQSATAEKYAQLARLSDIEGFSEKFGCSSVGQMASKLWGNVEKSTCNDYIKAVKMFYKSPDYVEVKNKLFLNVSLSNMKQVLGLINMACDGKIDTFIKLYIKTGKINLRGTLASLKAQMTDCSNDVDDPYKAKNNGKKKDTNKPENKPENGATSTAEDLKEDKELTPLQKYISTYNALVTLTNDVDMEEEDKKTIVNALTSIHEIINKLATEEDSTEEDSTEDNTED